MAHSDSQFIVETNETGDPKYVGNRPAETIVGLHIKSIVWGKHTGVELCTDRIVFHVGDVYGNRVQLIFSTVESLIDVKEQLSLALDHLRKLAGQK